MMIEQGKGLTSPYKGKMADRLADSVSGQASWADRESGKACHQCKFWGDGKETYTPGSEYLAPKRCSKFTVLMCGAKGEKVPFNSYACKFFEARAVALAITREERRNRDAKQANVEAA